mgnify:CR=1 FL=1
MVSDKKEPPKLNPNKPKKRSVKDIVIKKFDTSKSVNDSELEFENKNEKEEDGPQTNEEKVETKIEDFEKEKSSEDNKEDVINEKPDTLTDNKDSDTVSKNKTYYIVKKSGDAISVFFITEDGKQIKLEDTEIIYDLLPQEDQRNFDVGIVLEEQEQLSSLLQDFEG